jgi:cytochrome c-type biogenesis protein CcsB
MAVDVGLGKLSNDLIAGGIATYSLAFLAYAVDAAFGNHAPKADLASSIDVRMPALVGAESGRTGPGARLDSAPPAAPGADQSTGLGSRRVGQLAVALTVVGWLLELGAILSRGLAVHRLPWGNMYEFTLALTFTAVTAFLVIMTRQHARYLGVFVMTPVVLGLGIAVLVLYVAPAPLVPALHSYWLAIHVTAAIIASGVFTVATAATVMFLVADSYASATEQGKRVRLSALARIMPSADVLDRTAYRAYAFAFLVWTFAVVAGAIWAEYAWGHYWQWDPKETWAFITWVIFAGYLHARATAGWRGRKAAYIAMLGFATIIFNFFIVNIFITGIHSYAGV